MTGLIRLQKFNSMLRSRRLPHLISRFSAPATDGESDTSSTLPGFLDALLPECAKPCISDFIADNYCSSTPRDSPTLCTTTTTSGFTLGEATLICESSYCSIEGQVDKSIFSICASIPEAIRPSHDSINVIAMATSQLTPGSNAFSSALPPTIGAPPTASVIPTGIVSATGRPSIPSSPQPAPPPPSTTPQASPAPSPEPSSSLSFSSFSSSYSESSSPTSLTSDLSASSTATRIGESDPFKTSGSEPSTTPTIRPAAGNLSTGQIVGISLAALAVFGFVIGLLLFLYYRRRERKHDRRGSRWSDTIEKPYPASFSPATHHVEAGLSNAPAAGADHSQRFYAPPTTTQEKRRSFWRKSIKPEDIGVAVTPEAVQASTPTSISSQRTTSQLLPELPHYSLWPAPLRHSQQRASWGRRDVPQPKVAFPSTFVQTNKLTKPPRVLSSHTARGLPTDPRSQMYRLEQVSGVNSKIPLTPVYDNGNVPTTFDSILSSRQNALLHPADASRLQSQRRYDPRLQSQAATRASLAAQNSALPTAPPVHDQTTRLRQAPPVRRNSSASDITSFEDDDETTPEHEHDKQLKPPPLSPVIESPRRFPNSPIERLTTPLRDLTYPSPPRSAAISKQAEKQARPRAAQFVDTADTRSYPSRAPGPSASSKKDKLVLDERSFFSTASSPSSSQKRDEFPSSLLAKRKGDTAADQILQGGLKLSSSAANGPALNRWQVTGQNEGRARKGSDTENAVNMVLKTPPPNGGLKSPPAWTPRLTPTRQGDDLYLRVE